MTEWTKGILKDSLETEVPGRTGLREKKGGDRKEIRQLSLKGV